MRALAASLKVETIQLLSAVAFPELLRCSTRTPSTRGIQLERESRGPRFLLRGVQQVGFAPAFNLLLVTHDRT